MGDGAFGAEAGHLRRQGRRVAVRPAARDEWLAARPLRLSPDVLRFDSPERPLPSPEDEVRFWEDEVEPRLHVLLAIALLGGRGLVPRRDAATPGHEGPPCGSDDAPIGFLSFFARDAAGCETGIEILRASDHGRGYGTEAYGLALPWLAEQPGMQSVHALTHPDNAGALRMYEKLGFHRTGHVPDGPVVWVRLEKRLGS